ncbi:MAG: SPOR domain-containing protein [Methylophagaceae bacterium]
MTDILKQRLIGSLLLLLVIGGAAIFLIGQTENDDEKIVTIEESDFTSSIEPMPVEFVEGDQEKLLDPHQIDKQPDTVEEMAVRPVPEKEIVKPIVAQVPVIVEKSSSAEKQVAVTESSKPSWIIQLGSFSVKANAQALHGKASMLGLKSRVEKNGANYRVRIGPEYDKQLVDSMAAKISEQLAIKPQVLAQ